MFNFAIDAAIENPTIIFVLRLHPLVSQKDLLRDFPRFRKLPQNVYFSTQSLMEDFKQSKWILYRASSTAIYAVLEGLRPIYLGKDDEMIVDSLFGLKWWKKSIYSYTELKSHIDSDLAKPISKLLPEYIPAYDFCNNYFIPLRNDDFLGIIKQKV